LPKRGKVAEDQVSERLQNNAVAVIEAAAAYANGFAAAGAEIEELRKRVELLRAWAEDEQSKRFSAEEKLVDARSELARLRQREPAE
jgi:uncharacterized coiled-coil DUF342 family protein